MVKKVVRREVPIIKTNPSTYLLDVVIVLLLLPLNSTSLLSRSLNPLFSNSPVQSISLPFNILSTFVSVVLYLFVRGLNKQVLLVLLGLNLIVVEAVVRLGGVYFMSLGAAKGLWTAKLALETTPMILKGLLLFNTIIKKKYVFTLLPALPIFFLPLFGYADWNLPFLQLVPECFIYQTYGVLLIILVLSYPFSSVPTSPSSLPQLQSINLALLTLILGLATSFTSNHCPTSSLRPSSLPQLTPSGNVTHKLLASELGITGWISVGEQEVKNHTFRYLRSDHSLLGGLWTGPSRNIIIEKMKSDGVSPFTEIDELEVIRTAETIYSTFILQEIVRLARLKTSERETGLIIGLGVGISARAMQSHGIALDIVEIDPVVYKFARQFFASDLMPRAVYLQDARDFLMRNDTALGYDYIIHDVFTGGEICSTLFTKEFWQLIKLRLNPTGIVAINFAGNVGSHASNLVLATILESFYSCRAFEDGKPTSNYRNLVILCSKTARIQFRQVLPEDFLPYPSPTIRKRVLETFKEFEFDLGKVDRSQVLEEKSVGVLRSAQKLGAIQHWEMMKSTLPDTSWNHF